MAIKMLFNFEDLQFLIGERVDIEKKVYKIIFDRKKPRVILPCSLNDLALKTDAKYSSLYECVDIATCDSMMLTYFFRLRFKNKKIGRIYGPNLLISLLSLDKKYSYKLKHYFLAADSQSELMMSSFLNQFYRLNYKINFLGRDANCERENSIFKEIRRHKPDVIWLGIGSPKQLELANSLKKYLNNGNIFCIGAAFDFVSGNKKQAPLFIQNIGLEWLFRLINEPKRLYKRYLIVIPKYLIRKLWLYLVNKFRKNKQ